LFPEARPLPELDFVNHDGAPFSSDELQGQWSLLFMGFTNCGNICPTTMAKLGQIWTGLDGRVDVVFVSVDPRRDTVTAIREYVSAFNEQFTGLRAELPQLDALSAALAVPYFIGIGEEDYDVDHSGSIFVIDPSGEYAGVFMPPQQINEVVQDMKYLLDG
jgi:protein SCO1/2